VPSQQALSKTQIGWPTKKDKPYVVIGLMQLLVLTVFLLRVTLAPFGFADRSSIKKTSPDTPVKGVRGCEKVNMLSKPQPNLTGWFGRMQRPARTRADYG
jgi:hypothetical protein